MSGLTEISQVLSDQASPLGKSLLHHLHFSLAKDEYSATQRDYYVALVMALRERLIERWLETQRRYYDEQSKRVYYLSLEFLTGRNLTNSA